MNSTHSAKQTAEARVYNSPLRDRQAEQTRELILQALTEQLADAGLKDFSIPRLALRAGVSVRTVYRYFPTKDALLEDFAYWLDSQIGSAEAPATIEELVTLSERAFPAFDEMEPLIRAQWLTPHGRASREVGRKRRLANWRKVLADVASNLPAFMRGFTKAARELCMPFINMETKIIHGWVYMNVEPYSTDPAQMERRMADMQGQMGKHIPGLLDRWRTVYEPEVRSINEDTLKGDYSKLTDKDLSGLLEAIVDKREREGELHMLAVLPAMGAV